ncbi:MAG: DNA polymerase III subunit delta [Oligoflexia bacterium]|nr:DNA polymerase III subunit delta [Oligoflexia bacterium]
MALPEKKPLELLKDLKAASGSADGVSKLFPVYLVYGEEIFISERVTQRLKHIVTKASGVVERVIFGNINIDDWLTGLFDIPMFGSLKLVIASDFSDLKADEIEKLLEYVKSPSPDVILLLTGSSLDKRKKNSSKLLEHSLSCNARHPYDNELGLWIKGFTAEKGKSIDTAAVEFLKARYGNNLAILEKEIEKLSLFTGEKQLIESKDAEFMSSGLTGCSIFDLFPVIAEKNKKQAGSILYKLLYNGENHLSLLALITGRIKKLLIGTDLADSANITDSELAEKTGIPQFFLSGFKRELRQYKRTELKSMYKTCMETDARLKSSRLNKDDILLKGLLSLTDHK